MILEHLNYLPVAVCSVFYFAIGGLWYSPVLFSKPWVAGHKMVMPTDDAGKAAMKKKMPMLMLGSFLIGAAITIAIACIVVTLDSRSWMTGFKIGLVSAVLTAAPLKMSHLYTGKSIKTILIDTGYPVVSVIIVAIVLSVWR